MLMGFFQIKHKETTKKTKILTLTLKYNIVLNVEIKENGVEENDKHKLKCEK
jgi:hypothetical protein